MKTSNLVILFVLVAQLTWAAPGTGDPGETLMQGFPPPADERVSLSNFMQPPYNRWALQHVRELQPTREVFRGMEAPSALASSPVALDAIQYQVSERGKVSLDEWLDYSATDAFLVLHKGKIVYERYLNGMTPYRQHQMFSATKSFVGTLVLTLIEEGRIDPSRTLASYVAELKGSAFGDATVQQVLDMTTSIAFSEEYTDPDADVWQYGRVFRLVPADQSGREFDSIYDYLPTLQKGDVEHGKGFHYVTPNTDVLGWLLSRVTGKSLSRLIEERFWQPLGAERDAYIWLDRSATEMAGGGLNVTARDAARFGQMVLQGGRYNGRQIIPAPVAKRILTPGNSETFSRFYDDPWYDEVGHSYHDQWWSFRNKHEAVSAIGVHGQFIYLDPIAEMVVVKQSSHPEAEGADNEVDGPMIWQQMAEYLMSR